MILAEGTTALVVEALTLQVLFAESAIEALAMIVMVKCLHPSISGLNGEATSVALCGKEFIPIGLAVCIAIL